MGNSDEDRVVVAMSGGVDSSVAAALLVRAGYQVEGVILRLWSEAVGVKGHVMANVRDLPYPYICQPHVCSF